MKSLKRYIMESGMENTDWLKKAADIMDEVCAVFQRDEVIKDSFKIINDGFCECSFYDEHIVEEISAKELNTLLNKFAKIIFDHQDEVWDFILSDKCDGWLFNHKKEESSKGHVFECFFGISDINKFHKQRYSVLNAIDHMWIFGGRNAQVAIHATAFDQLRESYEKAGML